MNVQQERKANERAYRRRKEEIDRRFPAGHFVAIVRGEVIADAAHFDDLLASLASIEQDPERRLVVQAGASYPEYETIF